MPTAVTTCPTPRSRASVGVCPTAPRSAISRPDNGIAETGGDDDCACQSSDAAPPAAGMVTWLLLALRRRRRVVAGAALLVLLEGCGERRIPESDTEASMGPTTSTGESEDAASQSTGDEAIDDRFFGVFHNAYALGWKNDDPTHFIAWSQMEIRRDGTIVYHRMHCEVELETIELSWTYDPTDKAVHIAPNDGDHIDLGPCTFSAVQLTLGDDCGELILGYKNGSCSGSDGTWRYLPGLLCAEPTGEECVTEIVWCDEEPMPACQLP